MGQYDQPSGIPNLRGQIQLVAAEAPLRHLLPLGPFDPVRHVLKWLGGDREMVDILALVLQHDEQAVLSAVELVLDAGVPSKTHILNLLHRLVDGKLPAPDIDAPQALNLVCEPKVDVERYDALCATHTAKGMRHAS